MTALWGATFPIVKCSVQRCAKVQGGLGLNGLRHPTTPFMFLSLRFAIAALLVGVVSIDALRGLTRRQLLIGVVIGLALCGGYVFQTYGLQRTTATNAGFLTGLYVILTPLFGAAFLRKFPSGSTAAGAMLAFAGLLLLVSPSGLGLRNGDSLVLVCAALFAVHILLLGRFASSVPLRALVVLQLAVVSIATGIASVVSERAPIPTGGSIWLAIVATGILASALASFVQSGAQRFIPPARAAVILVMESPFAALFGFLMLGEHLSGRGWAGAALILCGLLVAELFAPASEAL